ncbi:hypothetical protein DFH94DRAFT_696791 [Russula ochroleuca]|uniref:Uncharacterized protein n=1 Tax=Russula ochroleuca TaxID=152965 RepID=A0A9P5JYM9_9AGAM|nr:hypothetical protein DFH94DRAFT_696791 [Russula ochroleuca]
MSLSHQAVSSITLSRRATSTAQISRRATSTVPNGLDTEPDVVDNEPAFMFGGISSDDEEVECKDTTSVDKYQSMTKVKDIHTTPLCVKHSSRRSNGSTRLGIGRSQASQARLSDLPPGTANHFSKKVLPLVFDAAGVLGPWECPNDNKIIVIWNLIFGSPNDHPIASSDVNGDLFLIVKHLIKGGILMWLHKFAMAAERALSAEFECQGANTLEERAMFVQFLLGDPDDISSKHCPFLWKSAYKASEDDEPNKFQGLFQGRLVTQTFLEHILATSAVDKQNQASERPVGALIISIQAVHTSSTSSSFTEVLFQVHRVLLYSTEGAFKPPHTSGPGGTKSGALLSPQRGFVHT